MVKQKVPVSRRALVQRINRALAGEEECLRTARGGRARQDLGDFYVVNYNRNFVVRKDVDPEDLARELKVLADHEALIAE